MPRLSHLTRPKLIDLEIDVGDGDVVTIQFDRNAVTAYWAHETQQRALAGDVLSMGKALAEVITTWNVTEDDDSPLPLTAENLSRLSLSSVKVLAEKIQEASVPGVAEGEASSDTSSTPVTASLEQPASPQNGPQPSSLPEHSTSPST